MVLFGGNRRSGGSADGPAYDGSVAPPYLVAKQGAKPSTHRAADGGVQALVVG